MEQNADFEEDSRLTNRNHDRNMKVIMSREERFQKNRDTLMSNDGFKLKFPQNMSKFPPHLREIFEFYKTTVSADDLIALQEGTIATANIVNLYFKILEKINLVLQKVKEFFRNQ